MSLHADYGNVSGCLWAGWLLAACQRHDRYLRPARHDNGRF